MIRKSEDELLAEEVSKRVKSEGKERGNPDRPASVLRPFPQSYREKERHPRDHLSSTRYRYSTRSPVGECHSPDPRVTTGTYPRRGPLKPVAGKVESEE